jgi:hemerythrin-like metal-binding protein
MSQVFRFLTLGLPTVDAEHSILSGFVNGLSTLVEYDDITAGSTAEAFISYFNRHAGDEETFMMSIGYDRDKLKEHRSAHTLLIKELNKYLRKERINMSDLGMAVNLVELHISTYDKKIAEFLRTG